AGHGAGVARGEDVLAPAVSFQRQRAPVSVAQRRFQRLGEALLRIGARAQTIDDDVDGMLAVLREPRRAVELVHLAVDPHAAEALRAQLVEQLRLLALARSDDRREHHEPRVLRQREELVDQLRDAVRLQRRAVLRAVWRAGAREKEPQVVVDLGNRADGRARIVARRLLLDGDGGREPLDQVDVGLLHQLEELARVRRERLDVASLPLGVERVEGKRALARAGEAGDHDQTVARQLDRDVLQVVRARAADANRVHAKVGKRNLATIARRVFPLQLHVTPDRMSAAELRAGASLAGVFGLRMFGLFLILPVLSVHAAKLKGGENLSLVGAALGIYGLAQGCLQIPFGMASDRWGRKPVLYAGLALFALGSFLGVGATDVWMVIAARALQGAGAISSVAMALAADLTREQHRTKIMAMIGSTIGLTFAVSLIGAPLLYQWIGMSGLFALTGGLCLAAMAV